MRRPGLHLVLQFILRMLDGGKKWENPIFTELAFHTEMELRPIAIKLESLFSTISQASPRISFHWKGAHVALNEIQPQTKSTQNYLEGCPHTYGHVVHLKCMKKHQTFSQCKFLNVELFSSRLNKAYSQQLVQILTCPPTSHHTTRAAEKLQPNTVHSELNAQFVLY